MMEDWGWAEEGRMGVGVGEGRALVIFLPTGLSSAPWKVFLSPDASDSLCKSGRMLFAACFKEGSKGCSESEHSRSDGYNYCTDLVFTRS